MTLNATNYECVPASHYSIEVLADIYNAARADYIVPMLTDAESLRKYVYQYDVDLDASVVILDREGRPAGINMLGIREDRGWITRLGMIRERRQGGMGLCMMQALIEVAHQRKLRQIQLEVIEGNEPAHRLFSRCGFQETRRLRIIQRMPQALPDVIVDSINVSILNTDEIWACLAQRGDGESWINENASLAKIEGLKGLQVILPDGNSGWVIFECQNHEINHVVLQGGLALNESVMAALLYHLHRLYPDHKTTIENLPTGGTFEMTLQQFNYSENFRRIEMFLHL